MNPMRWTKYKNNIFVKSQTIAMFSGSNEEIPHNYKDYNYNITKSHSQKRG